MSTTAPEKRNGFYTREQAEAYLDGSHNERLIGGILKQRQHLAKLWLHPNPCPNCGEPLPLVDAEHVEGDKFKCVHCPAVVYHTVPLFQAGTIGWVWVLAPGQIRG